jgi:hypothetical protein
MLMACALLPLISGLQGCAALRAEQTQALLAHPPAGLPPQALLSSTPFYPQAELQCGPAALAIAMSAAGVPTEPDSLTRTVFLPGRGGSLQIDMLAAPRTQGLLSTRIPPDVSAVLREVAAGHQVVVLLNLGLSIYPMWHYAVVIGYDLPSGEVVMHSGTTAMQRMPLATFEHTWARSGRWAFVVLPPDRLPATSSETDVADGRVAFERVAPPVKAAQAYRTALQPWPDNLVMALGLGNALYATGDLKGAAQVLAHAAQIHDSAPAWNNLASVQLQLGLTDAALSSAQRAVARAETGEPQWRAAAQATLQEVRQTLSGK